MNGGHDTRIQFCAVLHNPERQVRAMVRCVNRSIAAANDAAKRMVDVGGAAAA